METCINCHHRPPESGKKCCAPCLARRQRRYAVLRAARAEARKTGNCRQCFVRPPFEGLTICKRCYDYQLRERAKNRASERSARHRRKQREEALAHYGGRCACCDESRYEFLALDHMNGERRFGGNAPPPRAVGRSNLAAWARKHEYPASLRVLCHNCNAARGYYGYCPHERD